MENQASINITSAAARRVRKLIIEKNNENLKLRLYIVGGGCSGFQYGFSFDEMINEDDAVIHKETSDQKIITMLVDHLSLQYLESATVDYVEGLQGSRFVVNNPNAETTCGCGSSFSLKEE